MKLIRFIGLLLLVMIVILSAFPTIVAESEVTEQVEWTYENSVAVTVEVSEACVFSPADFPGIGCRKVFVLEKETADTGIRYKLVLWLDVENEQSLLAAMNTVKDLPTVQDVARTGPEEYVDCDPVLTLNHDWIAVPVGETVEIRIDQLDLNTTSNLINLGLDFEVDPTTFDFEDERWSWIPQDDIRVIFNGSDRIHYRFLTRSIEENLIGDEFAMVANLSQYSEFLSVKIYTDLIMGGRQSYEKWTVTSPHIINLTLSGGEVDATSKTPLNQTAYVRGLKSGTTTLTVERSAFGGDSVTATCMITVTGTGQVGDVDLDGYITAADALLVLQQATEKIALGDPMLLLADFDGNKEIAATDALQILQKATRKIY